MIISVLSSSGGVGKSTIATNLAVGFAHSGKSVCLIDYDPDGTTTSWYSQRSTEDRIDSVIINDPRNLAKSIEGLSSRYDTVIIDGRPALDESMIPVAVADLVLLPVNPSGKDIFRIRGLIDSIENVRVQVEAMQNRRLDVRFVVNSYKANTTLAKTLDSFLAELPVETLTQKLVQREDYKHALMSGAGVVEMSCVARMEVKSLTREILNLQKSEVAA